MWIFPLLLTALYCASYLLFYYAFPAFFNQPQVALTRRSLVSLACIVTLSLIAHHVSYVITDEQLANRFLHAFGGGFVAFLMCFLVVRDTTLRVTKFQFFVFAGLVVTALGVGNELLEFLLENTTHYIFSPTPVDTWLDLASNSVGALVAAAGLTPLVNRRGASQLP